MRTVFPQEPQRGIFFLHDFLSDPPHDITSTTGGRVDNCGRPSTQAMEGRGFSESAAAARRRSAFKYRRRCPDTLAMNARFSHSVPHHDRTISLHPSGTAISQGTFGPDMPGQQTDTTVPIRREFVEAAQDGRQSRIRVPLLHSAVARTDQHEKAAAPRRRNRVSTSMWRVPASGRVSES